MIVIAPLLAVVAVLVVGHIWQQWEFNNMMKELAEKQKLRVRMNRATFNTYERQHAKEWM